MNNKQKRLLILLLIIISLMYILINQVYAFSPENSELYEGIDVSGWQGNINYEQVKTAGIEVVYMKASEGDSFVDPYFEENYENAKANGLKVGFYHYLTARSTEEAISEANFFTSVIKQKEPDCRLAMDFESFGDLSREQINQIGITFMQEVEKLTGKEMIVYSDTSNASDVFYGELTNYPLWVAQYEVEEPTPNGNWSSWAAWQYTDVGQIAGINGNVDRDKFTKDVFLEDMSQIQNKSNETSIIIQKGDTLSMLAVEYNTTVAELVRINNIANPNLIYAGTTLILPTKETNQEVMWKPKQTKKGNNPSEQNIYIVQRGDTLNKIAQKFKTTVAAIAKENNIQNTNLIYVGQKLIIPVNNYDMNHTLYKIQWGDTLWSISRKYGVSIAAIVRLNRIKNPNLIYAGNTKNIAQNDKNRHRIYCKLD